jgi:hypothetical protein
MALSKIKAEFLNKVVAFGKSGKPLGERDDIDDLAIIALESGNKTLLVLFETLPSLGELKKAKTDLQLKKIAPVADVVDKYNEDPNKKLKEQRPGISSKDQITDKQKTF